VASPLPAVADATPNPGNAAPQQTTPLGQAASGFPKWLLETVRGGKINYDPSNRPGVGTYSPPAPAPAVPAQMYGLPYLFGMKQGLGGGYSTKDKNGNPVVRAGPSWFNAILYLLLVEVQKALWNALVARANVLATAPTAPSAGGQQAILPNQGQATLPPDGGGSNPSDGSSSPQSSPSVAPIAPDGGPLLVAQVTAMRGQSPVPDAGAFFLTLADADQQALLSEWCDSSEYARGLHGGGPSEQHALGGAVDIEYETSPYIVLQGPNEQGQTVYKGDTSYDNFGTGDRSVLSIVFKKTVEVWGRVVAKYPSSALSAVPQCPFRGSKDPSTTADLQADLDALFAFDQAIMDYFSQTGDPVVTADTLTVKPAMVKGDATLPAGSNIPTGTFREPKNGVIGFSRAFLETMLATPTTNPVSPYKIRWSYYIFGPDLMHFDVEHPTTPTITEVRAAETKVEAYLTANQAPSKTDPWIQGPAQGS
jgi:hypothetical protein